MNVKNPRDMVADASTEVLPQCVERCQGSGSFPATVFSCVSAGKSQWLPCEDGGECASKGQCQRIRCSRKHERTVVKG